MTRQISVHTGKFLENFRKHGRAVPAPSRSPHRLARWAERRTRMTRMRDKKAFPPSRVACSCVWSTDAVRVCTRWCVRLVTGDRTEAGGVCVLVYVCIRTDLILTISAHWPLSGRQIFEDFRALRAQANFDSNFGKSVFTPTRRGPRAQRRRPCC